MFLLFCLFFFFPLILSIVMFGISRAIRSLDSKKKINKQINKKQKYQIKVFSFRFFFFRAKISMKLFRYVYIRNSKSNKWNWQCVAFGAHTSSPIGLCIAFNVKSKSSAIELNDNRWTVCNLYLVGETNPCATYTKSPNY